MPSRFDFNVVKAKPTRLTGRKSVRFIVRFNTGKRPYYGTRVYGRPQLFSLWEVCAKLVDAWSFTEREIAHIVAMQPGDAPFVNEDMHIERRP